MHQEDRPGLRFERPRVFRAIVFLVAARPLVLSNHVVFVVVQGIATGHADLLVAAHPQSVEIERGAILDDERRFLSQALERAASGSIDAIVVGIDARQVDLRARNVEKAQRIPVAEQAGFVHRDDVVGNGGDARGAFGRRTKRAKRVDGGHGTRRRPETWSGGLAADECSFSDRSVPS